MTYITYKESLTSHQKEKLTEVLNCLNSGENRIVLQGSAGVGKTYLLKAIVQECNISKVACCAPTNKAVSVIKEKMQDVEALFMTVHSGLNLTLDYDNNGNKIFVQKLTNKKLFKGADLIIIDEASMLSEKLYDDFLNKLDVQIIFVGDEKQLNPVNEENSIVFVKNFPTITLTEIIRQSANNPIIQLSRSLDLIYKSQDNYKNNKGYLFSNDEEKILQRLAESEDYKYLAWTNEIVNKINKDVRKIRYNSPDLIEKDEILSFDAPYLDGTYWTNQEIKVHTVKIQSIKVPIWVTAKGKRERWFKVYLINDHIYVLHKDSMQEFKNQKQALFLQCKTKKLPWIMYSKFINTFASMKYNYAITVHKSQGSTYKNVILNINDIDKNKNQKEKQRLLYTGVTRASDLLILNNKI